MANMSYCRFQNTLRDLQDCLEHIEDSDLSPEESAARKRLLVLCEKILDSGVDDDDLDDDEFEDFEDDEDESDE